MSTSTFISTDGICTSGRIERLSPACTGAAIPAKAQKNPAQIHAARKSRPERWPAVRRCSDFTNPITHRSLDPPKAAADCPHPLACQPARSDLNPADLGRTLGTDAATFAQSRGAWRPVPAAARLPRRGLGIACVIEKSIALSGLGQLYCRNYGTVLPRKTAQPLQRFAS